MSAAMLGSQSLLQRVDLPTEMGPGHKPARRDVVAFGDASRQMWNRSVKYRDEVDGIVMRDRHVHLVDRLHSKRWIGVHHNVADRSAGVVGQPRRFGQADECAGCRYRWQPAR